MNESEVLVSPRELSGPNNKPQWQDESSGNEFGTPEDDKVEEEIDADQA